MSKMLDATCQGGVVTAEGVPVPGTEILGQGVGASVGALFLDEGKRKYVPKTSGDLEATLDQVIAGLGAAADGLTGCSAALSSVGALPPVLVPITAAIASLGTAKAALETLKGNLR